MSIKDVLLSLKILSKNNGLSEPYIVGGLPRDKFLNMSRKVEDVDLTTGDESIHKLAEVAVNEFKVEPTKFPDGHYQLIIEGIKYDFSSNFNSKDASYFLEKAGIKNPTPMQLELFSRDFTCNTLVIPMSLRKISDPTGLGIDDIKRKVLRTPLPSRITLRDDPKRIIRSIYLAVKLGFEIEPDIINWAKENHELISKEVSAGFAKKKLANAADKDINKTIRLLDQMDLWKVVSVPMVLLGAKFGVK